MNQINNSIKTWKTEIVNLINDTIDLTTIIMKKLVRNILEIKSKHSAFYDTLRNLNPLKNVSFVKSFVGETDTDKLKRLMNTTLDEYDSEIKRFLDKINKTQSFDLVNNLLNEFKKTNQNQYEEILKELNQLRDNLFSSLKQGEEFSQFRIELTNILGALFAIILAIITTGSIDSFNEKIRDALNLVDYFEKKQKNSFEQSKLKIDGYFNQLLTKIDNFEAVNEIIWFDLNVNNTENMRYQQIIKESIKSVISFKAFSVLNSMSSYIYGINKRTILIVSGSAHEQVFEKLYSLDKITDILLFASDTNKYKNVKTNYDKVYKVVYSVADLIIAINEILNDNTFSWVVSLNSINKKFITYNNDYSYASFSQIPKSKIDYEQLKIKAVYLKEELNVSDNIDGAIEYFIKIIKNSDEKKIVKELINFYTKQGIFYRLINYVLRDLNDENIDACQIWIKSLNLALKKCSSKINRDLTLYRYVKFENNFTVSETYKKHMAICFPAFTSTSSNEKVAGSFKSKNKQNILFQINYKYDSNDQSLNPPVDVKSMSDYAGEEEYLFSIFSIFYIKEIERLDDENYKIILTNLNQN